jgi:hypothetical protein
VPYLRCAPNIVFAVLDERKNSESADKIEDQKMNATMAESSANIVAAESVNTDRFIADQKKYFAGSYELFDKFGGPCRYFHDECLRASRDEFLSERHIEMLYATLTAWGMHRMGIGKTKLTEWRRFRDSIQTRRVSSSNFDLGAF